MITCFSFTLNGYVNYNFPTRSIIGVSAMPFPRASAEGYAYADKRHAEANRMPEASIAAKPYKWAKHMPVIDVE